MWFGWRDVGFDEACELGLEQAARFQWQVFCVEVFGFGLTLAARTKPDA